MLSLFCPSFSQLYSFLISSFFFFNFLHLATSFSSLSCVLFFLGYSFSGLYILLKKNHIRLQPFYLFSWVFYFQFSIPIILFSMYASIVESLLWQKNKNWLLLKKNCKTKLTFKIKKEKMKLQFNFKRCQILKLQTQCQIFIIL